MGRRLSLGAAALLLVLTGATGCSHGEVASSTVVAVHLRNFRIEIAPQLHAGSTRLNISSAGPTMHELVVVATDLPAKGLPVAANATVDAERPGIRLLGEAEGIDIGDHAHLTVRLRPGHYVMFCNMEGHYQAGMATDVTVV